MGRRWQRRQHRLSPHEKEVSLRNLNSLEFSN
jgi:hypothetical protein